MTDCLIKLDLDRWHLIKNQLVSDYGVLILISWKSREILGFAPRYHQYRKPPDSKHHYSYLVEEVHLDFTDAEKKTFFVMKYL